VVLNTLGDHLGDHLRRAIKNFQIGRDAHKAGVIISNDRDLTAFALTQSKEK
jgi:hypothetical protein